MSASPKISRSLMNLGNITVKPHQISSTYSLAKGNNSGVGFLSPNGTVTFHDAFGNTITVDHQHHRVLRNGK